MDALRPERTDTSGLKEGTREPVKAAPHARTPGKPLNLLGKSSVGRPCDDRPSSLDVPLDLPHQLCHRAKTALGTQPLQELHP